MFRYQPRMLSLLVVAVLTLVATAHAWSQPLPEGPLPALADDEGYLVVAVDTDAFLVRLHLKRLDTMFGNERLNDINVGRSVRVLRLPAGEYRWSRIDAAPTLRVGQITNVAAALSMFGRQRFNIDKLDASAAFRVVPGKLNYAGDLHLRFRAGMVSLAMPNRGERALALLEPVHDNATSLSWQYAGDLRDHYWTIRGRQAPASVDGCPDDLASLPDGIPSSADLFRAEEIEDLRLSPDGDLVLESAYRSGQYQVNVIEPATGDVLALYRGIAAVSDASWTGRRQVVVQLRSSSGVTGTHLFRFGDGRLHGQQASHRPFPVTGWVLDPLPGDEKHLLFGMYRPAHRDPLQVFRIDIARSSFKLSQFEARNRLDKGVSGDIDWLADANGQLRLAVVDSGGKGDDDDGSSERNLVYRRDARSEFVTLRTLGLETIFLPQWIEPDGQVLALSNEGRDQVELVRLDPANPESLVTVHAVPGIDLAGVARSGTDDRVVGVRYYSDGAAHAHFFDESIRDWQRKLAQTFPDRYAEATDIDATHGRAIVAISNDTAPPRYVHYDVANAQAIAIGAGAPWLEEQRFVARQAITVTDSPGGDIQALLAVPDGAGPHPLLVMPHGGPMFVQDVLRFDRRVQYWATRGFAVLQVNFRGSYGFGVRHLLAGFAGFGRQIEDDIDAAVSHVLARNGRIDSGRICAIGSSYGGYSSLMLALRDPDRYRCAVSIAGPTDLPLLFMSSDWNASTGSQEAMRLVVGDPASAELRQRSPLYRSDDFKVPVMLIHGENDRRVDYEHALRLATRLTVDDRSFEVVRVDGMGHGASTVGQERCVMGRAEQFLQTHIATP